MNLKKNRSKKLLKDLPGTVGRQKSKGLFEDGVYDIDEFHRVFIEEADVTEYRPAMKLIGSWQEWERIKTQWPGFQDYIASWKEELETKLKADALAKILEFTKGDDQKALIASKFFATQDYKRELGKGRPSKKEITREAKVLAQAAGETAEERKRIEEAMKAAYELEESTNIQ